MYRIGIDLGGTNIAVGVVDSGYHLISEASVPAGAGRPAEQVVADMCRAVELALDKAGLTVRDCASIGVGAPGTCDPQRGVVVCAYNLGWFDVPVCRMLTEHFGLPARLSNDANCAALAETVAGAAVGCRNMVLITLGTGVGGGIVVEGKLLHGAHGSGAEIGHLVLNRDETVPCNCGKRGCVEQYCSATGIVRLAKRHLDSTDAPSSLRTLKNLTCKDIFDEGKAGDKEALIILDRYYAYMGEFLGDVCTTVDPEVVVIGGGVSKAGQVLIDGILPYFHKYVFHAASGARFTLASLGNDAGAYGAFKLALDAFHA